METDAGGQDGGSDILKRRRVAGWGGADRVKGGCSEAALGTECKHPRRKARHRAKSGVAGASVAKRLAADTIVLRGERESSESGGVEVSRRTQHGIQTARAEPEVDIVQAKQIVRCAGATGVLAGAEKEVKTNDETVGGSASHRGVFQTCGVDDRGHNGKRERFDAFGGAHQVVSSQQTRSGGGSRVARTSLGEGQGTPMRCTPAPRFVGRPPLSEI
jgi:hypothetical protein